MLEAPFPSHSRDQQSPSGGRAGYPGQPMYWAVYKEMYLQLLETRCAGDSEHPANVRRVLDRFTRYLGLADRRLDEIRSLDLERYVSQRNQDTYRGKPIGRRTLRNEIRILNAAFAKAGPRDSRGKGRGNWCLIDDPPWIEEVSVDRRLPVVIEPDQFRAFLEAARHARSPRPEVCNPELFWTCALVLDAATRLRRKGLLRVPRPEDHRLLDRREIFLPAELNKTREDLVIALGSGAQGDRVVRLLSQLPTRPGEPFLPWKHPNGRPMTLGHFNNTMARIQRDAGIDERQRIRLKDVRSTAGTLLLRKFGEGVAKQALGHSPNTNTLRTNYNNPLPREEDRAASDLTAGLVMQFVEPDKPTGDDGPEVVRFPTVTA